jgi:glutamine amidotransferase
MCRHAAYVGPGIAAAELLSDLDHSLLHQSYQARELLTGTVCADGYGFGWHDADGIAGRYGFGGPIWSDRNLTTMANKVRGRIIIGAVRNATVARGNTAADAAPFHSGDYLWSLNGFVTDFETHWRDGLFAEIINPARRAEIHGQTDGEYMFAAWLSLIDASESDRAPLSALQTLVRRILNEAEASGKPAFLNILASDSEHVYATRAASTPGQNSLYTLFDGDEFPDAWVVASEPLYDDPMWEPLAPDSIIVLSPEAPPIRLAA